jgi:GntR family transcriptional repressor for pyruvate dehydrogenase complex
MGLYKSVRIEKISGRIAQQIKESILNGSLKPGDQLPPVRELAAKFEASPASVREALKMLESFGLVTMKPGSGVYVTELSSQPMHDCLSSILRVRKTSLHEVMQARLILEPGIARLAAENRTTEDVERLESILREALELSEANAPTDAKNLQFHAAVAESSHNVVLAVTMQTVLNAMHEVALEVRHFRPGNPQNITHLLTIHRELLGAIRERKNQDAYDLMVKDIESTKSILEKGSIRHKLR